MHGKYDELKTFCENIADCKLEDLLCCSKIFTNVRNFSVHITKVHRNLQDDINAGNVFVCKKCPQRIYRSQYALQRHYKEYHKVSISFGSEKKGRRKKSAAAGADDVELDDSQNLPDEVSFMEVGDKENGIDDDGTAVKIEQIPNDDVPPVKLVINDAEKHELAQYECGYCRLKYETGKNLNVPNSYGN